MISMGLPYIGPLLQDWSLGLTRCASDRPSRACLSIIGLCTKGTGGSSQCANYPQGKGAETQWASIR